MLLPLDIHSIIGFVKPICAFMLSLLKITNLLTFVPGVIIVRVAIIYQSKKNGLKVADFFKECSGFVDSLATNSGHLIC